MIVLAQRGWQAFSGLLTLYLVTQCLSPEDQGYYYTITSLIGVLLALDFGLTNVLVPFAAKHSPLGTGDGESFYGIGKYATRWFLITGLLMLLFIPVGIFFLGLNENSGEGKHLPMLWSLAVIAAMANYVMSPYVLLLEGAGEVRQVYQSRLKQGVLASLLMWLVLISGWGLFAVVIPAAVAFLYTAIWLKFTHPKLLKRVKAAALRQHIWSKIWPLQWRTGANVFAGFLLVFIYTPMVFSLFGPKEAGQVGLTMSCMNTIFVLSISGLVSNFPRLTQLISESKENEALQLYRVEEKRAGGLYAIASTGLIVCLIVFKNHPIASRFMEVGQTLCVAWALFFYMRASAKGYLMRAHLVDYSLKLNLFSLAIVAFLSLVVSHWIGLWGFPVAMVVVFAGFLSPSMSRLAARLG